TGVVMGARSPWIRQGRGLSVRSARRRRCAMFGVVAAAALVLAACGGAGGGGEDGPVTLTVTTWDAAEEEARDPYLQLVEQFVEEHPDITIEQEPIPFSDIEQQLLQRVQAGNAPDVTQLAGNYTFNLNAAGALEPRDELAGDEYLDQIVPEVRELGTVEDELISAPWAL